MKNNLIQKTCNFCQKEFMATVSNVKHGNGKFCSFSCRSKFHHMVGRNIKRKSDNPIEFFEKRYMPEPNTGCWLWLGDRNNRGYGYTRSFDKREMAHRFSLEKKLGRKLLNGMNACHKCDTPACVNPDHLFEGTQADNINDAIKKGRIISKNKEVRY
jgi:hypothetical protein